MVRHKASNKNKNTFFVTIEISQEMQPCVCIYERRRENMQYKKLYHYNHKEKGQRGNGGSASSYNGVQGHVGGGRLKDTAPSVVIPSVRTSPHR